MYTILRAKIGFKWGIKETWGVGREIFFYFGCIGLPNPKA
jgi:hypothetical protein